MAQQPAGRKGRCQHIPGKENQQKDGVLKSVEEICEATWKSVYKFIYYKVQNREEAEDITQETYVKAMANIPGEAYSPKNIELFLKTVAFLHLLPRYLSA
ncbi:RNA polymerase sigma factor [Neobacillus niacini]|uniref:RNA polymerase sigma factor n=1 Tax=Neobacillus niacini TaxID=86668 RepID=UPI0021CB54B8|nr:sigma factor [Neobacillus niacini]MCM3763854.1 hypothetical protein [Neobacillus niacini]